MAKENKPSNGKVVKVVKVRAVRRGGSKPEEIKPVAVEEKAELVLQSEPEKDAVKAPEVEAEDKKPAPKSEPKKDAAKAPEVKAEDKKPAPKAEPKNAAAKSPEVKAEDKKPAPKSEPK
ncbi:MAG TPA: hypothetical protein DCZ71_04350, partial [Ruminococcus sp.]|nr:hypothetical protein [Ruminococcus sp.]